MRNTNFSDSRRPPRRSARAACPPPQGMALHEAQTVEKISLLKYKRSLLLFTILLIFPKTIQPDLILLTTSTTAYPLIAVLPKHFVHFIHHYSDTYHQFSAPQLMQPITHYIHLFQTYSQTNLPTVLIMTIYYSFYLNIIFTK